MVVVVTTYADQVAQLLAAADQTDDLFVLEAAAQVELAFEDTPWQVWPRGCDYMGRASADPAQRVQYDRHCTPWETRLQAAMRTLADALTGAGFPGWAEVAESTADQADTMGEQADQVIGDPAAWWEALPPWVRWAAGLIAARELLGVWGDLRR